MTNELQTESVSAVTNNVADVETREKILSLFEYIRELNKLKQKSVINIKEYPYLLDVSSLPVDRRCIEVHYRDRVAEEEQSEASPLLAVRKPEMEKCPKYPKELQDWLYDGWDDYTLELAVKDSLRRDYIVHPIGIPDLPAEANVLRPEQAANSAVANASSQETHGTPERSVHPKGDPGRETVGDFTEGYWQSNPNKQ